MSLPKTGSDGGGYRLAQDLDHSLVAPTPALVPLALEGDFHQSLSGISQDVEITVSVEGRKPIRVRGSLLWTHFGISGPVVLDASRHWHRAQLEERSVSMTANFLPGQDAVSTEGAFLDLASRQPKISLQNALSRWLPARVAEAVLRSIAMDAHLSLSHVSRETRSKLLLALRQWSLPVRSSRGFNFAEVTAGGIPLDEIEPTTMASRKCPGLYLVGEILDVDGRIGGFNFQWSWSTAWVAAKAIAAHLTDNDFEATHAA
jgi:predicted Rossmann fold flavoprotein